MIWELVGSPKNAYDNSQNTEDIKFHSEFSLLTLVQRKLLESRKLAETINKC